MFVYLWPALVGGKILSPIAVLYKITPWKPYLPPDVGNYENFLLADVPFDMYPWREFMRQLIHAGTFPAWNPHVETGLPFFSNPQTGLFSLFSLPLWILPLNAGLGYTAALMLWAAAFGTYLLVRELRLGFLPGLLAGVAYGFCSMNIMWLTPQIIPAVAALLPWMLWLIERTLVRRSLGSALGIAVVTAIALGGGHPGTQVHVLLAAGVYALVRAAVLPEVERGDRTRRFALASGGLVLGALLMAVMLVPESLSSHDTVGTTARQGANSTLPGSQHMPFGMIRTVLFPDWWGRPSAFEATNSPEATMRLNYEERTFYAGVITLLLACVGMLARGDWRRKGPFVALGAVSMAIVIHTPGLFQLVEHLPVLELVENQRLHFVFELALAVLAAFGLHALLERPRGEQRRLAVPLVALTAGLIAAVSSGASGADVGHVARHFLTGADFQIDRVVALTSVAWFLLFSIAAGAALIAARRWPRHSVAIAAAVVLLAAGDMLHFAHGYNPMGPAAKIIPPRTPAIAYLQRHASAGRFVGLELALSPDWSMRYGLRDARGYDPPFPTKRFLALWRVAKPEQDGWRPTTINGLDAATVRVISVLGARYVIADPGAAIATSGDPALTALHRVYDGKDATIFENPRAVPRAIVAPRLQLVADEQAVRAAIAAEDFDPRTTVVLERDQAGVETLADGAGARGTATVVDEQNARVTLHATLDRRGVVLLDDQLTRGWTVTVDGHDAHPLHADDVMRGVVVGAGRHEIVWSYAVPGLRLGAALSALSALLMLATAGLLLTRRRRQAGADATP